MIARFQFFSALGAALIVIASLILAAILWRFSALDRYALIGGLAPISMATAALVIVGTLVAGISPGNDLQHRNWLVIPLLHCVFIFTAANAFLNQSDVLQLKGIHLGNSIWQQPTSFILLYVAEAGILGLYARAEHRTV
ncbi:MAG: hypothetical protein JSS72_07655 [Armatimonadetes bacterium]|nr:hypothetical protein [Armatimonadota bacterium]